MDAVTTIGPGEFPKVMPTPAWPNASVVVAGRLKVAVPEVTENVTGIPEVPTPPGKLNATTKGAGSAVPVLPLCPSPPATVIPVNVSTVNARTRLLNIPSLNPAPSMKCSATWATLRLRARLLCPVATIRLTQFHGAALIHFVMVNQNASRRFEDFGGKKFMRMMFLNGFQDATLAGRNARQSCGPRTPVPPLAARETAANFG